MIELTEAQKEGANVLRGRVFIKEETRVQVSLHRNEVVMNVLRITIVLLVIALIMALAAVAVGYLR